MSPRKKIAIVSTFANACGGSEGRAVQLYRLLKTRADVELWTEGDPDPELASKWPIQRVRAPWWAFGSGDHPRDADLIFVGAPRFGRWVHRARAGRVTLIYNTDTPTRLERRLRRIESVPKRDLRLVFASERLADSVPHDGVVQLSPIDLERFSPVAKTWDELRVGRMSRDERYKHGETDPELYRRLVEAGCAVRIQGGVCLAEEVGDVPGVELTPSNPDRPERFLQSLDVFIYRTRTDWFEASARVVVEALACGLPVIAHVRGGYTEYIRDGENGFLFETDDEAFDRITALQNDPARLADMKSAARRSAEALYDDAALNEIADFYLGG